RECVCSVPSSTPAPRGSVSPRDRPCVGAQGLSPLHRRLLGGTVGRVRRPAPIQERELVANALRRDKERLTQADRSPQALVDDLGLAWAGLDLELLDLPRGLLTRAVRAVLGRPRIGLDRREGSFGVPLHRKARTAAP